MTYIHCIHLRQVERAAGINRPIMHIIGIFQHKTHVRINRQRHAATAIYAGMAHSPFSQWPIPLQLRRYRGNRLFRLRAGASLEQCLLRRFIIRLDG